jgi:ABC-type nitrate/sulfonate/bicarbonate transport system permease component
MLSGKSRVETPTARPTVNRKLYLWVASPYFWRLLSLGLVFGVWELMGQYGPNMAIPPFSATVKGLFVMIVNGTLARAYFDTLKPLTVGLLLAATIGIGFGITMGLSRTLEWFTLVVFIAFQVAPMAAVIPLVTFIYGLGFTAKMMAVFVLSAPGITLNSYQGVRNVNTSLIQMSQAFLATRRQQIVKVIIPAASSMIIASLRMGLGAAFVGIILAELLITPTGLGDLITYYQCIGDYANMYATICSLIIISAVSISLLKGVENSYAGRRERKRLKKQPRVNEISGVAEIGE